MTSKTGVMRALKGNLHTHTDTSDGDSPVGEVARWYDDHDYDFLVITDHNVRVAVDQLQAELVAEGRRLLLIPGEELTAWWEGPEHVHALHLGAIGTGATLGASEGNSVVEVLQAMIDRVVVDGGLASLNHPNFWESITSQDMAALNGLTHFEVFNGHPLSFNNGTEQLPSMDTVWDILLTAGRRILGIAVDDAHHFQSWGPDRSNPGRGWVTVNAERDGAAIVTALRQGNFYSSTGPDLQLEVTNTMLTVGCTDDSLIELVVSGEVVASIEGTVATCLLPGSGYARTRVTGDSGSAWSQPVWV